jgi:hypothetical protein
VEANRAEHPDGHHYSCRPEALRQPYTVVKTFERAPPGFEIMEYVCTAIAIQYCPMARRESYSTSRSQIRNSPLRRNFGGLLSLSSYANRVLIEFELTFVQGGDFLQPNSETQKEPPAANCVSAAMRVEVVQPEIKVTGREERQFPDIRSKRHEQVALLLKLRTETELGSPFTVNPEISFRLRRRRLRSRKVAAVGLAF